MSTTTYTDTPAATAPAIVLPHHDGYDTARRAWNLAADQRPAAICAATSIADVQAAIAYAREHGLRVAPQTTGHLAAALPSLDGTLLLKLALHDGDVEVDPAARTVRVKAGALWGDVVDAVAPHGLAVMHGSSPTVGVIGYLLGGGLSFYGRAHGLAANHVRAFEIVDADGVCRRVEDGELLWALRGGGGGTAVVTAVELGLLDVAEVFGGALFWPAGLAPELLRTWLDWTRQAPDSVTTTFRILRLPELPDVPPPLRGVPVVCIDGVALDEADGAAVVARLTAVAEPMLGGWERMPSAAVARLHGDPEDPVPGIGDGRLLDELDDAAVEAFLDVAGVSSGSSLLAAELRQLGGALAAPPAGAGVRGHLEGRFLLFGVGMPMWPEHAEVVEGDVRRLQDALMPWATGTRFLSFAERHDSLETCVPDASLQRLRAARAQTDGGGLFVAPHALPR